MSRMLLMIDSENEQRVSRQRKFIIFILFISLSLFAYPEVKDYYPKWKGLRAARKVAAFFIDLKVRSVLEKKSFEAKFVDLDKIIVQQVTSCGPAAQVIQGSASEQSLNDFENGIQFLPEPWIRQNLQSKEPFLRRFCYDPEFGSSLVVEGLVQGRIFLAHKSAIELDRADFAVQIVVDGPTSSLSIE